LSYETCSQFFLSSTFCRHLPDFAVGMLYPVELRDLLSIFLSPTLPHLPDFAVGMLYPVELRDLLSIFFKLYFLPPPSRLCSRDALSS